MVTENRFHFIITTAEEEFDVLVPNNAAVQYHFLLPHHYHPLFKRIGHGVRSILTKTNTDNGILCVSHCSGRSSCE